MTINIQEIDESNALLLNSFENRFTVHSRLVLSALDGVISYTIEEITPFVKQYPQEECESRAYISSPGRAVFFAFVDGQPAGQVRLHTHWNRLGYIEDIAVDEAYRRRGAGQTLLQRAVEWARDRQLPGLMLETQDVNVDACRLYERCGFILSGFDRRLYMGFPDVSGETALFWYYPLEKGNA